MGRAAPSINHQLPMPLEGFEGISRFWDKKFDRPAAKILPGEFYVSTVGELIVTVLGSCIAVCIRDIKMGVGGMNHFMLPEQTENSSQDWTGKENGQATRYGNWAMEYLINEIYKAGGKKKNLEVKIFGGGSVLSGVTNIGLKNADFVREYIDREGLTIVADDTGDVFPRKVLYFSDTGSVKVRKLRRRPDHKLEDREMAYNRKICVDNSAGSIDLF